jgi:D-tyrosyl-tRNA(Tyr) deacylase
VRAVIQRVSEASVTVSDRITGSVGPGLLILIGIEEEDTKEDLEWLSGKILHLRIFNDNNGVMNCSILETAGEMLVISQFTLHASTKKGNRPSYIRAAKPETAIPLYHQFLTILEQGLNKPLQTGEFGAMMKVSLINDGPVTVIIDTKIRE